jgi:hypothetical protein
MAHDSTASNEIDHFDPEVGLHPQSDGGPMSRLFVPAVAVRALLLLAGCGMLTDNEPQPDNPYKTDYGGFVRADLNGEKWEFAPCGAYVSADTARAPRHPSYGGLDGSVYNTDVVF